MIDGCRRHVVDGHGVATHTLHKVALLATHKHRTLTSKLRIEGPYALKDLSSNGHITATRHPTAWKEPYVRAEIHGVGDGLCHILRHPTRLARLIVGDNRTTRSHSIIMAVEEVDIALHILLDDGLIIIYEGYDIATAQRYTAVACVRQALLRLKDIANVHLWMLGDEYLYGDVGIILGVGVIEDEKEINEVIS